jgi:hypothetical protein
MNHDDWIREEFPVTSRSLGFIYTPAEEIGERHRKLRKRMEAEGMEAFLVVQKMDYYYLCSPGRKTPPHGEEGAGKSPGRISS